MKKRLVFGVLSLLTVSFLLSQSLVDASKKEQERREKLKGKDVKVVTNADLKAKGQTPAVVPGAPEAAKAQPRGQAEPTPGEGAAAEAAAQPEQQQQQDGEYVARYAGSVFPDFQLVENPEQAVGAPDDLRAEISGGGVLDLEIEVNNGPGDDLVIYAKPPAKMVAGGEEESQVESYLDGMWRGDFRYVVFGLDSRGEWQDIGLGSGQAPDRFDLGALKSTGRIRIAFKGSSLPYNEGAKPMRLAGQELTIGVDAVGALH
jgi:hypothetical protein